MIIVSLTIDGSTWFYGNQFVTKFYYGLYGTVIEACLIVHALKYPNAPLPMLLVGFAGEADCELSRRDVR